MPSTRAGDLVEQGLNKLFGNQEEIDWSDAAVSAAVGSGMSGTFEAIGQKVDLLVKGLINSDATRSALEKEVKKDAKKAGTKTTPSSVRKAVDAETKEMTKAAETAIEVSFEVLVYSCGFYNDVLTDER